MKTPKPYANSYLAGVGLGLVLLAAFVLTGQGLGASGAFASVSTGVVSAVAPQATEGNAYFESYLADGAPWTAWMVKGGSSIEAFASALSDAELMGLCANTLPSSELLTTVASNSYVSATNARRLGWNPHAPSLEEWMSA